MARYEPKTDSREFEVATQGQDPGAWGGDSASDATDIAIRLWGPEWSGQPGSLTWKTDSVFVYMIADLVLASHGRLAEESATLMAAHFDNSRQALVAAKRIQMSILDFVACRPGNGVAIVIHQPSMQGATSGLVQAALQLAKPGQILVGGDVSRHLRESLGVDLVSVSALAAGAAGQRGLAELVWTTADRLASLQSSVVDGAPSRRESPPVGATMIVSTPIVNASVMSAPIRGAEPEASTPVVKPVAGTDDFVHKRSSDSALQRTPTAQHAPDLAPRAEDVHGVPGGSLTQELDELEQRPFLTRTRIILGLAAIVLVGALIAVLYLPTHETKIPPRALENRETGSGSVDSKSGTVHTEPPQTQPQPPQAKTPEPQAKLPKAVVQPPPPSPPKPAAETRVKNKKDNPEQPQQPPVVRELGGLSQNDVPTLLRLARDDAGAGKYDKARSEYKKILQLQPGNQDAKDGLRRLDLIKGDNE
jgi:hypothetical protein